MMTVKENQPADAGEVVATIRRRVNSQLSAKKIDGDYQLFNEIIYSIEYKGEGYEIKLYELAAYSADKSARIVTEPTLRDIVHGFRDAMHRSNQ